jgi:hypothetical protein
VLSDDGQGADKHKMERFMQAGGSFMGSVYAPISYPPLPLLAFKVGVCAALRHLTSFWCSALVAACFTQQPTQHIK